MGGRCFLEHGVQGRSQVGGSCSPCTRILLQEAGSLMMWSNYQEVHGNTFLYSFLKEYFLLSTDKMYSLPQIQHLWAFWDKGLMGSTSEKVFLVRFRRPKGEN